MVKWIINRVQQELDETSKKEIKELTEKVKQLNLLVVSMQTQLDNLTIDKNLNSGVVLDGVADYYKKGFLGGKDD